MITKILALTPEQAARHCQYLTRVTGVEHQWRPLGNGVVEIYLAE